MILQAIKQELARRKWSGYRLGKESGVAIRTVQELLAGQADPKASTLDRLFKALGLEVRLVRRKGR